MSTTITPLSLLSTLFKRTSSKFAPKPTLACSTLPHPPTDNHDAWKGYWQVQGHSWRTEPEIDEKRQEYLAQRRSISPNIEQGIYPFKEVKLSRADVEWLLATHEDGRGPVDWIDQRNLYERTSLDLRGANLQGMNLNSLPLTRMRGGLNQDERILATTQQCEMATVHLEKASLVRTHLERADLFGAHLEEANLFLAYLKKAFLSNAHLEKSNLFRAHLEGAFLRKTNLEGVNLREAHLEEANLENATLSNDKQIGPQLADVHWDDINLSAVRWSQVRMLGDEQKALQKTHEGCMKDKAKQLAEYERAVRANRQLAIALQSQGLDEEATRFVYRAQVLQKCVFWFQMIKPRVKLRQRVQSLGAWLFSWFLYLLAGYGYRLGRSFLAYLLVISLFMTLYHVLDPHLAWNEAFVVSMTAFHGRGFSPSAFVPGDPLSFASAAEAFVGLIVEVTFIATLTQRFFNR